MSKIYASLTFLLFSAGGYAQQADSVAFSKASHLAPIATDRPDQTESPYLVPVGYFQIETGFMAEAGHHEGQPQKNVTYHSSLLKYGLSTNFELRLITEYLGYQLRDAE